jgi:hypothetical protein
VVWELRVAHGRSTHLAEEEGPLGGLLGELQGVEGLELGAVCRKVRGIVVWWKIGLNREYVEYQM